MNHLELEAKKGEMAELSERASVIQALADTTNRDLTSDEMAELNQIFSKFQTLEMEVTMGKSTGRKAEPNAIYNGSLAPSGNAFPHRPATGFSQPEAGLPKGFRSFGDYFRSVHDSCQRGGTIDSRLIFDALPAEHGSEGISSEGGFLVPPSWSQSVMTPIVGEGSLLDRCNVTTIPTNTYVLPKDETTPWASSGGIQAYWEGEAHQLTPSKPSLSCSIQRLNKLTALVPVTDELLEDAPALDSYLRRKVQSIFDYKIKHVLLKGNGSGQPLGILNGAGLVSVSKETGQLADTLVAENIISMYSRLMPGSEESQSLVWLASKTCLPQLLTMSMVIGTAGFPMFLPAGSGLAPKPTATLLGAPLLWSQVCNPVGDQGDIILADLSFFGAILKASGLKTDVSMHLYFDYGISCYRFIMRLSGQPILSSTVLGADGSTTYSPFVALAERA